MTRAATVFAVVLLLLATTGFSDQSIDPPAAEGGSPEPPPATAPPADMNALRQQLIQLVTTKSYQMSAADLQRAILSFQRPNQQLPPGANEILDTLKHQTSDIQREANRKIRAHRKDAIVELKKLQDLLTREAKLDEAVAVRDLIRTLQLPLVQAHADPGTLTAYREHLGRSFYFRVTGTTSGYAYGTDVYTDDSQLATAAVHAGALADGETGIVKVTITGEQQEFPSSNRNGVTSSAWGPYSGSFRVERAELEDDEPKE